MSRGRAGADGGAVTAELVVALPAVMLVLAVALGAVGAVGRQVLLADAAASAARLAARDEPISAAAERVPHAASATRRDGDLVCVRLTSSWEVAGLLPVPLSAEGCAVAGPR